MVSASTSASNSQALDDASVQLWFTANFDDDETQLTAGVNTDLLKILSENERVCGGLPSLQTKATTGAPNGACPAVFTGVNDSCTCLMGYSETNTTWEFHVQAKSTNDNFTTYPVTLSSSSVLTIDAIRTLWIPSALERLRIVGVGSSPVELTFVPEDRTVTTTDLPITQTASGSISNLVAIEIINVNMAKIAITASVFLPSTTTNITLRNCAISSFGYEFTKSLNGYIEYLDLSMNSLVTAYAGSTIAHTCANSLCGLKEFNISYNKLSTFPESVFNVGSLQKLYIQGNNITDFNISASVFESIQNLVDFKSDLPDARAQCNNGSWEIAHGSRFCVLSEDTDGTAAASSSNHSYLLYIAIGGGVVVFVLLIIVLREKYYSMRLSLGSLQDGKESIYDDAFHLDASYIELSATLKNDPIIITSRIDLKDLTLDKCISRGSFGLIYTGEYKNRPVAIKKIRVDHRSDVKQLRLFIQEITLMATLHHSRIVEFIGAAWSSLLNLCAVTELMEGGDLRDVLRDYKQRGCPLQWRTQKMTIALHIAEALMYLHSLTPKVIHRDLKSKNVLLNTYFDAKLTDFGVSREHHYEETHMTAGVGTTFWIAPEVLVGKNYDERADIFSFGVVLSELDTDDYPYWNSWNPPGDKIQEGEILRLVSIGELRPEFSDECPPEILQLAGDCLETDPRIRPTAAEIIEVLQQLVQTSHALTQTSM